MGLAFSEFKRFAFDADADFQDSSDSLERTRRHGQPDSLEPGIGALMWLLRNEATSYMLLGDPAVSLRNH